MISNGDPFRPDYWWWADDPGRRRLSDGYVWCPFHSRCATTRDAHGQPVPCGLCRREESKARLLDARVKSHQDSHKAHLVLRQKGGR